MAGFGSSLWRNLKALPGNIKRDLRPGTEIQDPTRRMRRNFLFHIHSVKVTQRALRFATTGGLGLISAVLFGLLAGSGLLLMVYYVPTPEQAYGSMLDIEHAVSLGSFMRTLHRWAAHALVLTACLHLLRVAAAAAYRDRELNWFFGLGMLLLTLFLSFTGYLLPWDQRAYWAVTVSANMADHLPLIGFAPDWTCLEGLAFGRPPGRAGGLAAFLHPARFCLARDVYAAFGLAYLAHSQGRGSGAGQGP